MKYRAVVVRSTEASREYIVEAKTKQEARTTALAQAHEDDWGAGAPADYACDQVQEEDITIPQDVMDFLIVGATQAKLADEISQCLDTLVLDIKSLEASNINNCGAKGQIRFLRDNGVGWNEIRKKLGLPEVKGGK